MNKDRTNEVEKRLEEIHVSSLDTCAFYKSREGSCSNVRYCAFCRYGKFKDDKQEGLCKFRKEIL